jgi:excisionase family DNA binding protein
MAFTPTESQIINVPEGEHSDVRKVEHFIAEAALTHAPTKLVGTDGSAVELPPSVLKLLHAGVQILAQGVTVHVGPSEVLLTTQEAADTLNVSRPHLIKLLEQGAIPYTKTGTHRRVRFKDVLQYKARRDAQRAEALTELTQVSQDMGLYDG